MITITQHIEYLMMYNDCVVIPGWGALIANYASSSVESGKVARPGRLIGFNSTISHNDGMLATSLMPEQLAQGTDITLRAITSPYILGAILQFFFIT